MNNQNWPFGINYGEPNHTLRTPRVSRYDGQGAWAKDSSKIPPGAYLGAAVVIGLFIAVAFVGAAAGF